MFVSNTSNADDTSRIQTLRLLKVGKQHCSEARAGVHLNGLVSPVRTKRDNTHVPQPAAYVA